MDALSRRLKLRDDLKIARLVERGQTLYMYKVVETRQYYRVNEVQHDVLGLMDGTRTADEIISEFNATNPGKVIDRSFIEEFVENLRSTEIFERTREEKKGLLLEKMRDQRRRRAAHRNSIGGLFEITVSAWDPDRFFDWLAPRLRFFWSRGFVILSASCILVMLGIWSADWARMSRDTLAFLTFQGKTGADLAQLVLIFFVVGFVHESAHGLTCKHFGGSVRHMGFLLLYFTPCFFVDVSDAYLFDRHAKRQWVIYAGGYIEMFLCSLATFLWTATSPGSLLNDLSYKVVLVTGISAIIINYNPLIKLDGYYSLMDFLEIPDLWERSFAYVSGVIKRTVFRLPVVMETPTRKVRRIMVAYCLASVVYKVFLTVFFLACLRGLLVSLFGRAGNLALGFVVLLVLKGPVSKLLGLLKFTILDKKEILMTRRSLAMAAAIGVPLLAAVALPRFPVVIRGECILEPATKAFARASAEGTLESILAREGQRVRQGEALALLRNDSLIGHLRIARAGLELLEGEIAQAAGSEARAVLARKTRERDLLRQEIRVLAEKAEGLTLRSPVAGIVASPRLEDLSGTYLSAGQAFCEISDTSRLLARVPVRERRMDEVRPGQRVALKVAAHPFRTFQASVIAVAPASAPGASGLEDDASRLRSPAPEYTDFEAVVSIAGGEGELKEGMSGTARIEIGRSTLAGRAGRALRRLIGSRIW